MTKSGVAQSPYNLIPDKEYPFHVPGKKNIYGSVMVVTANENVVFKELDTDEPGAGGCRNSTYLEWDDCMQEHGYVILPLVERGGACVTVDIGTEEEPNEVVGCLLRNPETQSQWDPESGNYQVLVREDNSVAEVFFVDVLKTLIPIGTVMYLRTDVIQDERFVRIPRGGKYLYTRLNVPNVSNPVQGKIYVTGVYRRKKSRTQTASTTSVTFPVNPWDVIPKNLFKGDRSSVIRHLD